MKASKKLADFGYFAVVRNLIPLRPQIARGDVGIQRPQTAQTCRSGYYVQLTLQSTPLRKLDLNSDRSDYILKSVS